MATDAELLTQAGVIKNETTPGANTAPRIGQMFEALINNKPNNTVSSLTDWDMDTNLFPANSKKGQRYFGIITTSSTLVDNQSPPQPLPSRIIATSLQDNASTSNQAHWAFQTTQ